MTHGIVARDEVALRLALEECLGGYTLYRLTPAAARRWKCRYRIMFETTYFDCQTVAEAYARALLAALAPAALNAATGTRESLPNLASTRRICVIMALSLSE